MVTEDDDPLHRRRGRHRLRRALALPAVSRPRRGRAARPETASPPRSGERSPASPASSPMSAARPTRSTRCRSGSIRRCFTGTSVIFFAVTNAVKLMPYFALGQFDATNLAASAVLMPIAPLATLAGAFVVRRMRPRGLLPVHLHHGRVIGRLEARLGRRCRNVLRRESICDGAAPFSDHRSR